MDTETEYGVGITNRYAFLEDNEEEVAAEMPKKEEKVDPKVKGGAAGMGAKGKTSAAVKSGKGAAAAAAASKTDNSKMTMKGSFINLYVKGNYVFVLYRICFEQLRY
jgi:hypothetical protein